MKRLIVILALAFVADNARAQSPVSTRPAPKGWEVTGIPALNFDADEGFGYGALMQIYNYGAAAKLPYVFTIQPTVLLTHVTRNA